MKRREFLEKSAIGVSALSLPLHFNFTSEKDKKITILHTNDQHSRIEPFPENDKRNANKGGFARRATLIESIRNQEENVLLLDAGDIFQGTPYFNFYGGELEFKLMSLMKYDAATMGNHDFDNGIEGFNKQLPHAQFSFLCSNYDFENTVLEGKTQAYKIFKKGGIKIGVFGIGIELNGLVSKELYKETKYLNPIEMAEEMVKKLKEKNCDLIICLSHLGYDYKNESDENRISDTILAQKTSGIDLILGGHTHTFLPEPQRFMNKENQEVLINQVGFAGLYLGRIDCYFNKTSKEKSFSYINAPV